MALIDIFLSLSGGNKLPVCGGRRLNTVTILSYSGFVSCLPYSRGGLIDSPVDSYSNSKQVNLLYTFKIKTTLRRFKGFKIKSNLNIL